MPQKYWNSGFLKIYWLEAGYVLNFLKRTPESRFFAAKYWFNEKLKLKIGRRTLRLSPLPTWGTLAWGQLSGGVSKLIFFLKSLRYTSWNRIQFYVYPRLQEKQVFDGLHDVLQKYPKTTKLGVGFVAEQLVSTWIKFLIYVIYRLLHSFDRQNLARAFHHSSYFDSTLGEGGERVKNWAKTNTCLTKVRLNCFSSGEKQNTGKYLQKMLLIICRVARILFQNDAKQNTNRSNGGGKAGIRTFRILLLTLQVRVIIRRFFLKHGSLLAHCILPPPESLFSRGFFLYFVCKIYWTRQGSVHQQKLWRVQKLFKVSDKQIQPSLLNLLTLPTYQWKFTCSFLWYNKLLSFTKVNRGTGTGFESR